jgi:hypothetical protein
LASLIPSIRGSSIQFTVPYREGVPESPPSIYRGAPPFSGKVITEPFEIRNTNVNSLGVVPSGVLFARSSFQTYCSWSPASSFLQYRELLVTLPDGQVDHLYRRQYRRSHCHNTVNLVSFPAQNLRKTSRSRRDTIASELYRTASQKDAIRGDNRLGIKISRHFFISALCKFRNASNFPLLKFIISCTFTIY